MRVRISNKGQITIPISARRKVGIEPNSVVEVAVTADEVTIRPVKPLSASAGVLSEYARPTEDVAWEAIRQETESAVAQEVAGSNGRRVRGGR